MLFTRLVEAGAQGQKVYGSDDLARAIASYARSPLILEDHPWLQAAAPRLLELGGPPPRFGSELTPAQVEAAAIDTAVTVAMGAIPETGSILINVQSPLAFRLSLHPRCHIVIVPAARAGLTMSQALEWTAQEPSGQVSWLTGPSRTADIEKILVLGAQGSQTLKVLIYFPETAWNKFP